MTLDKTIIMPPVCVDVSSSPFMAGKPASILQALPIGGAFAYDKTPDCSGAVVILVLLVSDAL